MWGLAGVLLSENVCFFFVKNGVRVNSVTCVLGLHIGFGFKMLGADSLAFMT